ncbi:MAG: hypothetical protein RLZZ493_1692 [Bacteroidota bacterium]|jgi:hypothetical protein
MKKLANYYLITLIGVISFTATSQVTINTTPASGSNICDGTATVDTTTLNGNILTWNYQGAPIQVGGDFIDSLCPGTYAFTYIDSTNSFAAVTFAIGYNSTPTGFGDTIVINGASCLNPIVSFFDDEEDCSIDYNAIDTAYLANVQLSSTFGYSLTYWHIVDTLGNIDTIIFLNPFMGVATGCYHFTLMLYCYQKSLEYKTLVINQGFQVDSFLGIEELSTKERKLIRIVDILGRETELKQNEILLKCYDDGTTEKVFIHN